MKSNINVKTNKPDKNKIILSVGMIVKNEEKHLDKCLSALKKLLDKVPSELIIVDTGSTDKSKEIALKYTDKVYDFEWNNDFSAARNHGLKKAVGEWFMFVDADEYLDENCDEMITFFNDPEVNQKYNSASILLYNYGKTLSKPNNKFLAPRIVRLLEGVEFHDAIHEWIPQPPPHGCFSTVFHHYGYSYSAKADIDKKADRNVLPILEEYKEHPKDLRVLAHLCDATHFDKYFKTYDDKIKYYLEYIEVARQNKNEPYGVVAYYKLATFYCKYEKFFEAIKIIDEFFETYPENKTVINVALYYFKIVAYMNLSKFEEAYNVFDKFFKSYEDYNKGELSSVDLRYCVLDGITEASLEMQYINAANCTNHLGKFDECLKYLDKMDLSDMNFENIRTYLNILRDLVRKTRDYDKAARCYEKMLEINDDDKTGLILFLLGQYYLEHRSEREKFADAMIKSKVKGKFIDLMKICRNDFKGKDISNDIQKFIDSVTRWNDGYDEAIYLAIKTGADMSNVIKNMSNKIISENLQLVSEAHYDFAKVLLDYCEKFDYTESIRKMAWMVTAFERAVPTAQELSDDDKGLFFDTYMQLLSDYVMNIYNPDLLNEEDVEVLPQLHRFGYYMTLAFTARNEGQEIIYVRLLKEALHYCEPMKDVVQYYLTEFENSLK